MAHTDEFRLQLEKLRLAHEREIAMVNATAAFEHSALRPAFLLNGGALIVFLALYGAITHDGIPLLSKEWAISAGVVWVLGLILATLATAEGYKSQFAFRKNRGLQRKEAEIEIGLREETAPEKGSGNEAPQSREKSRAGEGERSRSLAKCFWVLGLFAFLIGVILAAISLVNMHAPC